MTNNATKDFWIFKQNLLPTLLIFSHLVGYDFDDDDLNAIEYGLTGTSNEKNIWWSYQLVGDRTINLRFAYDEENNDIIFFRLSFDKDLCGQVDLTIFMVLEFDLQHRHSIKAKL